MRGPRKQYEKVTLLPEGSLPVKVFAQSVGEKGIAVAHVYWLAGKEKIKIVDYYGINFVLPVEKVS